MGFYCRLCSTNERNKNSVKEIISDKDIITCQGMRMNLCNGYMLVI